ncbi:MAG: peptide deformylase [bacterium]
MAILPIYLYGQAVLRKRAKAVKKVDAALRSFVDDMLETMHHANGIGLAANQVGSLERVIVVDISDVDEKKHEGVGEAADRIAGHESSASPTQLVLINPEVVASQGAWKMEEGCLSIPDIRDEVERAETVNVRYTDLQMNEREIEASGLLGRVLLHEIDHLNGILFFDRLGTVKRKLMRGRLNKILKGQVDVAYPVMLAEELAEK